MSKQAKLMTSASVQNSQALSTSVKSNADKKLFTPGPLGIAMETKSAMLRDLGSRDVEFMATVKAVRSQLLKIADVSEDEWTTVPIQGSGTFAIEATLTSTVPRVGGKVFIAYTGSYGQRLKQICDYLEVETVLCKSPEDGFIDLARCEEILQNDKSITNVCCVHCETSSGVIHPVHELGELVRKHAPQASYFVDGMSSFGAVPIDFSNIDYMVSSANKCIEGVPGFAYVLARRSKLLQCKGISRSLSLDVYEQFMGLETNGQFRFTPPTHAILAFKKALDGLEEEGGSVARAKRYQENRAILRAGMSDLGFVEFLSDDHHGYIITSFRFPEHPNFDFSDFYARLNALDQVIYPGKVTEANCFRIGNIGDLHAADMHHLLVCVEKVLADMGVDLK